MAKIDDLAELLVEELSEFKVQLKKMEELTAQLKLIKIMAPPKIGHSFLFQGLGISSKSLPGCPWWRQVAPCPSL